MIRPLAAAALLVIPASVFAETELDRARSACESDVKACARVDELEAAERAEADRRYAAEQARREAEEKATLDRARAAEEAGRQKDAVLRAKCGKDYMRVRVGMSFVRVRECAGPLELKYEDQRAQVYTGSGGIVRVEKGKVTRVAFE